MPSRPRKHAQHRLGLSLVGAVLVLAGGPQAASLAPGLAPDAVPIEVETHTAVLETHREADGAEVAELAPAREIHQGRVVYYTLTIRNPGKRAAHNVVVTKPVPANTRYVSGSAIAPGATTSFSIDGGVSFASPRDLSLADGQGVLRPAPSDHYTHIRWQMRYPLAPGAVAYARFRAVFR